MPSHKHKKKKKSHKNEKKRSSLRSDDNSSKRKGSLSESDGLDRKSPMRTYKHKKKKKSNKELKKDFHSCSENEDISWKIKYSSSDSDDTNGERRLKSYVRKSYLNQLNECLNQNFKMWAETCNEFSEDSAIELSTKFSTLLEHNALRACMIPDLYTKFMTSLITQIDNSTRNAKLYIEGDILRKLKSKLPLNKETQTNKLKDNDIVHETATQTEFFPISPLLPKLPAKGSNQLIVATTNISDSYSETGISSSQGYEPNSCANSIQECCNISSTSDILNPSLEVVKTSNIYLEDVEKETNHSSTLHSAEELPKAHSCLMPNKSDDLSESHNTTNNVVELERRNKKQKLQLEHNSDIKANNDLDSRLSELGMLNFFDSVNENSPGEESFEKPKRSNWFAEEIAQSCNFTRVLMKLTTKQREKVLKKIKDIFGDECEQLTELSEKNITICRKRIASVVVAELTPIYQGKRIASRYLFKYLAKKITKSIMDQSYAPDSRSIRLKVREYFSDGKIIMSESDCT